MSRPLFALSLASAAIGPFAAHAAPDLVGADRVAMGSASLAAHDNNAAITTNPGLLALTDRYDFSAQLGIGPGMHWGATAMDGRTAENVAMGFTYAGDRYEPALAVDELPGWTVPGDDIPNMKREHDFALALSGALAEDRVAFGVGGHLAVYDNDRNGKGTTGNVDVGVGLRPTDFLTVGVAGNNLVPLDVLGDRPMRVGTGVMLHGAPAAIEVDGGWVASDEGAPFFLDAGTELRPGAARLRVGGRYDGPTATPAVTGGVGIAGEGGALEYGIEVPLGGAGPIAHVFGVRFGAPAPIALPD